MKGGIRVINSEGLFAHILKQDEGRIDPIHHVHVNLPHPPADIDRVLEVCKQLGVAGRVHIAGPQPSVVAKHLIDITTP